MSEYSDISQDLYERIESYLNGGLADTESALFEREMEQDEALKAEVELQRELIRAVELGAMEATLREIEKERQFYGDVNAAQPRRYWYALAASFLALIAVGVWILAKPSPGEALFAEYTVKDPGLPVPMSATTNYQFYDAMVDYKNEKYNLAFNKWSELHADNPSSDTLNYFLGSALFQQQKYAASIPYFEAVSNQGSPAFSGKSQYYLVLSWLQTGAFDRIDSIAAVALPPYRTEIREIEWALREHR